MKIQLIAYPIYLLALLILACGRAACARAERRNERIRKELTDLYYRRARRFDEALAPRRLAAPVSMETAYAFSGWVELLPEGKIEIAGQTLDSTREAFDIAARDENHIPRAAVVSNGKGMLLITSHGMRYAARWENQGWRVELLPDQKSLPQGG